MQELQGARSRLVVKNTFLDFVDDHVGEPEESCRGLRARASSDPSLFETPEQEARKEVFKREEQEREEGTVEFEMDGMSDSDANTEEDGVADLPCYSHIAEAIEPGLGSVGAGGTAPDSPAQSEEAPYPSSTSASMPQGELERLISENARLVLENRLLRNQCVAPVVTGCAPVIPATPEQAHLHRHTAAQPVPETVWVPVGFMMPAQAPGPQLLSRRQRCRNAAQHAAAAAAAAAAAGGGAAGKDKGLGTAEAAADARTTVMLRNLPNNYSRAMVLDLLDSEGFAGKYDFLYLPIDFKSRACLGYAFINLVDPADVQHFWSRFDGYSKWVLPSKKVCHVSWSGPHQGLQAHTERYRNSPLMHKSVPDEHKPVVFRSGTRVDFPMPTKTPRAPRIRHLSEFRAIIATTMPC